MVAKRKQSRTSNGGTCFGDPVVRHGVHHFMFEVRASQANDGRGIVCGVAAASRAWGLAAYSGRLAVYTDCVRETVVTAMQPESGGGQLLAPSLQGNAQGALITIIVDMSERTLAFAVNDGVPTYADIQLPSAVRPFFQTFWPNDDVVLATHDVLSAVLGRANLPAETLRDFFVNACHIMPEDAIRYSVVLLKMQINSTEHLQYLADADWPKEMKRPHVKRIISTLIKRQSGRERRSRSHESTLISVPSARRGSSCEPRSRRQAANVTASPKSTQAANSVERDVGRAAGQVGKRRGAAAPDHSSLNPTPEMSPICSARTPRSFDFEQYSGVSTARKDTGATMSTVDTLEGEERDSPLCLSTPSSQKVSYSFKPTKRQSAKQGVARA